MTKHPDDVLIWADGTTATREDVERGDYAHMSDDYREATEEEIDAMNADLLSKYHRECARPANQILDIYVGDYGCQP